VTFSLWVSLNVEVHKTSPDTLKELRSNTCLEISAISGKEPGELMCSAGTQHILSRGQHFQHLL
jgi:hypothetical protein